MTNPTISNLHYQNKKLIRTSLNLNLRARLIKRKGVSNVGKSWKIQEKVRAPGFEPCWVAPTGPSYHWTTSSIAIPFFNGVTNY
jgi:hypothetical protein